MNETLTPQNRINRGDRLCVVPKSQSKLMFGIELTPAVLEKTLEAYYAQPFYHELHER
jgi:hypothetical protein